VFFGLSDIYFKVMEKIYLIGFMGSGKTTVGRELSLALGWRFLDTDEIIEQRLGIRISKIFSEYGQIFFRMEERNTLQSLLKENKVVIATGGGMPVFFNNLELMKNSGYVVYISVSLDLLRQRLNKDDESTKRPLAKKDDVERILNFRLNYYNKAHYICDADNLTPLEVANKIKGAYKRWKKSI